MQPTQSRRDVAAISLGSLFGALFPSRVAHSDDINWADRDRQNNKYAVIRDDYWFISGKTPPRLLNGPLKGDDPAFNAFGSCTSSDVTGNSCTYVSLKQRAPAYTKYASSIRYAASQYQQLGRLIQKQDWNDAAEYLQRDASGPPPPIVDAELKAILFATALLTSPNFPGPSKELLIARYYINELHYSNAALLEAVYRRDSDTAASLWDYGRDCWNSYYQVIDRQIVPKVGEKLDPIV